MDVLCWGDRRRLAKLERIGRRFHCSVVKFFREIPFLRLNFELRTWYLHTFICQNIKKCKIYTIKYYYLLPIYNVVANVRN